MPSFSSVYKVSLLVSKMTPPVTFLAGTNYNRQSLEKSLEFSRGPSFFSVVMKNTHLGSTTYDAQELNDQNASDVK